MLNHRGQRASEKQADVQRDNLVPPAPSPKVTGEKTHRPGNQGLTLSHFSAQRKRFQWDRGRIGGLFNGFLGGAIEVIEICRVYFVSETAQVELKNGRVQAPASNPRRRCELFADVVGEEAREHDGVY